MLPELTSHQEEQTEKQLTTDEYQNLKITDANRLKQFYKDWLDAFAGSIREAACTKCIPPWLLASIVLGEVTAMDTFFGINERTLENFGFGDSVGPAQITIDTALKYGLTETAENVDKVKQFVANRMRQAISHEGIAAEWAKTPIDSLDTSSSSPYGPDPNSPRVDTLVRLLIRWELLNPITNIEASARNIKELFDQAKQKGKIENYAGDGSEPWGKFDFDRVSTEDCPVNIDSASDHPSKDERMRRVASLFGGAHNDDSLSGFNKGYGLTQGENAGNVADDLIGFDLIEEYDLEKCPEYG